MIAKQKYHHGALREALVAAGAEVLADRGIEGFSLREAARRAGVSAAAPSHHFGDARGLLTAIATAAFLDLGAALDTADHDAAAAGGDRGRALLRAYLDFAMGNPDRFDLIWRRRLLDTNDPAFVAASTDTVAKLHRIVRETAGPEADPGAATVVWAAVHGLARLVLDGALRPSAAARLEAALTRLAGS